MNIRTPKRFRRPQRRSIFPFRSLLMLLVIAGLVYLSVQILNNREALQQQVEGIALNLSEQVGQQVSTLNAPPPAPTQDPAQNLIAGDNAWQIGNSTEAVRSYEASLDAVPNNVDVHNRVALGLLLAGNTQQAVKYAQKAVLADPFSSDAWAIRAWALSDNDEIEEAISSAIHATSLDPENTRAQLYLARTLVDDEQFTRAKAIAEEILVADPDNFEALWVRGLVREQQDYDFSGALADYRAAYDLSLTQLPAMSSSIAVNIALVLLRPTDPNDPASNDTNGALAVLEGARSRDAENTNVLYWLGLIYFRDIGDPTQAQPYLQQCVDYNPDSYTCYYLLGRTQYSLKQTAAALLSLEEATVLASPVPRHWWWAANAYYESGNCEKAAPFLKHGVTLLTTDTEQGLVDAYDFLISSCGLSIARALPVSTPEATPEATPDSDA